MTVSAVRLSWCSRCRRQLWREFDEDDRIRVKCQMFGLVDEKFGPENEPADCLVPRRFPDVQGRLA